MAETPSSLELLELCGEGQHLEQVRLVHDGPHAIIEDVDGVRLDVELGRSAAEVDRVQVASPLVEADHARVVQAARRVHDDLTALAW